MVPMAIGISESTGNTRIYSNNNIRDFIRDPDGYRDREIRGKYMVLV